MYKELDMRAYSLTLMAVLMLCGAAPLLPATAQDSSWQEFRSLLGEWVSAGNPEEGTGGFTLRPDLQGQILIRRNWANIPASKSRPAAEHQDLMIIYKTTNGNQLRASYFDNEKHIIQYSIKAMPEQKSLVFLSDAGPAEPRFRLTYTLGQDDLLTITFDIAPPGKPDQFMTYLKGTARRKRP
jgi:hypothetical protein